jgi:hypothetical protein
MKTFYVNAIYDWKSQFGPKPKYGENLIGLFGEKQWDGRGNFCGWYGVEYYLNTEAFAHYVADCSRLYRPEKRISDVTVCDPPIKCKEIQIGSCYWEYKIEAETVEEAIEKFKNAQWHK